jgi:hypothetical protein
MHAYVFHTGISYFIVSGCCCGSSATGVITGSNGIALQIIGLDNLFDDSFPPILLKLRKGNRN